MLREDFMEPLGISINRLARDHSVPPNRISEIVNGKRSITADTALNIYRIITGDREESCVVRHDDMFFSLSKYSETYSLL
jgi:addiction module HigA family antidote